MTRETITQIKIVIFRPLAMNTAPHPSIPSPPTLSSSLPTTRCPAAPQWRLPPPTTRQPGGGEATLPSRGRINGSTASSYNQLQYPTASNYGSMKKRKRGGGGGGGDHGSVTSPS